MPKVIFESWREGLQKVSLTKLQTEMLGKGLKESKTNTDNLLNEIQIIFEIDDENVAKEFFIQADKLGVNCKLIEQPLK
jgi:hypothetical protein